MNDSEFNQYADRLLQGLDYAGLARDQAQRHQREREALLATLLALADPLLDLAEHCRALGDEAPPLCRTVQTMERQALQLLAAHNVIPMAAVGGEVDLRRHEVIEVRVAAGVAEDTVLAEVCRGYQQGEQILRRAKVVIAAHGPQTTSARQEGNEP